MLLKWKLRDDEKTLAFVCLCARKNYPNRKLRETTEKESSLIKLWNVVLHAHCTHLEVIYNQDGGFPSLPLYSIGFQYFKFISWSYNENRRFCLSKKFIHAITAHKFNTVWHGFMFSIQSQFFSTCQMCISWHTGSTFCTVSWNISHSGVNRISRILLTANSEPIFPLIGIVKIQFGKNYFYFCVHYLTGYTDTKPIFF